MMQCNQAESRRLIVPLHEMYREKNIQEKPGTLNFKWLFNALLLYVREDEMPNGNAGVAKTKESAMKAVHRKPRLFQ